MLGECQRKKQAARVRLLQELLQEEELPYELVTGKLMVSPSVIRGLEGLGAVHVEVLQSFRNPVKQQVQGEVSKNMSHEQQAAVDRVMADYDGKIRALICCKASPAAARRRFISVWLRRW